MILWLYVYLSFMSGEQRKNSTLVDIKGLFYSILSDLDTPYVGNSTGKRNHDWSEAYLCPPVEGRFTKRPSPQNPDRNVMQLFFLTTKRARRGPPAGHGLTAQVRVERRVMPFILIEGHSDGY